MGQEHAISIDTLLVPRWLKSDWLQDPHMIGFTMVLLCYDLSTCSYYDFFRLLASGRLVTILICKTGGIRQSESSARFGRCVGE